MSNLFLACLLFILSMTTFSFTTSYGALERTFQGLDEVFIRECVNATGVTRVPYFDSEIAKANIETYFANNLDRYSPMLSYQWEYVETATFTYSGERYPVVITISLEGDFLSSYHYENSVTFSIVNGDENE